MERAIPKNKGVEFGSELHQLGADFTANPYAPALQQILLQIDPDCKERLPKRRAAKAEAAPAPPKRPARKGAAPAPAEPAEPAKGKKPAAKLPERKRKGEASPVVSEPPAPPAPPAVAKKKPEKPEKPEKPAATKKKVLPKKKPPEAKGKAAGENRAKEGASAGLSKRKPR